MLSVCLFAQVIIEVVKLINSSFERFSSIILHRSRSRSNRAGFGAFLGDDLLVLRIDFQVTEEFRLVLRSNEESDADQMAFEVFNNLTVLKPFFGVKAEEVIEEFSESLAAEDCDERGLVEGFLFHELDELSTDLEECLFDLRVH